MQCGTLAITREIKSDIPLLTSGAFFTLSTKYVSGSAESLSLKAGTKKHSPIYDAIKATTNSNTDNLYLFMAIHTGLNPAKLSKLSID